MLGLNDLIAANERVYREARAAARGPIQNPDRFRIVAVPGSQRLLVFHKEPPRLRLQTINDHGQFVNIPPRDSERQLAEDVLRAPVLRITRSWDDTSTSLRRAQFCVDRDAGGFTRWNGTVCFQIATGFAALVGVSTEVFQACFSNTKVVPS